MPPVPLFWCFRWTFSLPLKVKTTVFLDCVVGRNNCALLWYKKTSAMLILRYLAVVISKRLHPASWNFQSCIFAGNMQRLTRVLSRLGKLQPWNYFYNKTRDHVPYYLPAFMNSNTAFFFFTLYPTPRLLHVFMDIHSRLTHPFEICSWPERTGTSNNWVIQ
jgi:hypothetical protein